MDILCVCHGNIGRSPMMAAFLRQYLDTFRMLDARVESAGISEEYVDKPVDESVHAVLKQRGIDVSGHKSRHVGSVGPLTRFDYIVCVGNRESAYLQVVCPDAVSRIVIVEIPDVWDGTPEAQAAACADLIDVEMQLLALRIAAGD